MAVYQDSTGMSFPDYYMSQHPEDYTMGGSPIARQPSGAPTMSMPPPNDVDRLMKAVMASLEEPPEEGIEAPPQAPFNPMQGGWRGALSAVAAPYNQYTAPLIQPTLEYQQAQALGYPRRQAETRAKVQDIRLQRRLKALDIASQMEGRALANEYRMMSLNKPGGNARDYPVYITQRLPDGTYTRKMISNYEFLRRRAAGEQFESAIPVQNRYIPTTEGIKRYGSYGNAPGVLTGDYSIPPLGATETLRSGEETAQAIHNLQQAYDQAREVFQIDQGGLSDPGAWKAKFSQLLAGNQWTRDVELKKLGIDPQEWLNFDSDRKRALNAYVKQQTGAQFSLAEMDRYLGQFPLPWDDPDTTARLLQNFTEQAIIKMNSVLQQYAALRQTNPNAPLPSGIEIDPTNPNIRRLMGQPSSQPRPSPRAKVIARSQFNAKYPPEIRSQKEAEAKAQGYTFDENR